MTFVDVIRSIGLIWYLAIMTISFAGWLCTLFVYNQPTPDIHSESSGLTASIVSDEQTDESIGISILRPMLGLEPNLKDCLISSFTQKTTFPFEIILSVASPDDQAIPIAKQLIEEFPDVNAHLVIGEVVVGVNPKINNLVKSYEMSKYPILWILDSNTWTSEHTLQNSVQAFNNQIVKLVHHIPIVHSASSGKIGGLLDEVYMATMHAKMYAIINFLSPAPCVMGKSNLLRKSELPGDGLRGFGKYIAEDHLIAVHVWKGHGSHVLGKDCVRQPVENIGWAQYSARRIRWVRVRKYMTTVATLVEPFTECFLLGAVGASALANYVELRVWKLWLVHVIMWLCMDRLCYNRLRNHAHDQRPPFSPKVYSSMGRASWLAVWLIRESSALPLWLIAMSSDKIGWRGTWFVIHRDMTAHRVDV